jgi:hypothetical protein
MVARRALYVVLSVWSLPWFLLVAADQRLLLRAHDADQPEHLAVAMGAWIVAVGCTPLAFAAILLVAFLWTRTPPIRRELVTWFALLVLAGANFIVVLSGGSHHATLTGRIVAGWIDVALNGSLVVLPLWFLAASFARRHVRISAA